MTPQKVTAALKRLGFTKSTSSTTSVRGWSNRSPGFKCAKGFGGEEGAVIVTYIDGDHARDETYALSQLGAMRNAVATEFDVEHKLSSYGGAGWLIVREKVADPPPE